VLYSRPTVSAEGHRGGGGADHCWRQWLVWFFWRRRVKINGGMGPKDEPAGVCGPMDTGPTQRKIKRNGIGPLGMVGQKQRNE
jgi:hypothetical protein